MVFTFRLRHLVFCHNGHWNGKNECQKLNYSDNSIIFPDARGSSYKLMHSIQHLVFSLIITPGTWTLTWWKADIHILHICMQFELDAIQIVVELSHFPMQVPSCDGLECQTNWRILLLINSCTRVLFSFIDLT